MELVLTKKAKPFLKWAGGKSQLLEQIISFLPDTLKQGKIQKYYEPFLGGGALFFWLITNYDLQKAYINEINPDVANSYIMVQTKVTRLIKELKVLEKEYIEATFPKKEEIYYLRRQEFNKLSTDHTDEKLRKAALLIFLNKTCFNGLYRVNSKGDFNVPYGRYKKPSICNEENLLAVHYLLQKAEIMCGDFQEALEGSDQSSFIYFDPPYRPLSKTSNFTSYAINAFDDEEQKRLHAVYEELSSKRAKLMLSNSDPKNTDNQDVFFDSLYHNYRIHRLKATRLINCNAEKRGTISEILVMNY